MKSQTIFKNLARYYDLFYSWKNYQREAEKIAQLIERHKTSPGQGPARGGLWDRSTSAVSQE